jgi:hypothetical protein
MSSPKAAYLDATADSGRGTDRLPRLRVIRHYLAAAIIWRMISR